MRKLPRDAQNDYTPEMATARRAVVTAETGAELKHTGSYSLDPAVLPGNIEGFSGIVQMPMGFAGQLQPWHAPDPRSGRRAHHGHR